MKISTQFNRFFHGVVCKQLKEQATSPMKYQNPFTKEWFLIDIRNIKDDTIYQLLKLINPYYPKLQGLVPASTTVLEPKHLTKHIQWIERWAAENGVQLNYVAEEWEKLLNEAGITK